ncbi:MAG TPA: proton-conducting transporter membrane subunit [Polyangia bacterium]
MSFSAILPPIPVALPLLTAALLGFGGKHTPRRLADAIAIAVATLVTCATIYLAIEAAHHPIVYWFGGWKLRSGVPLGIAFVVDEAGAILASTGGLLTTLALLFSLHYFDSVGALFHALMLIFLAGVCGFCLTGDLFNLFVWFELMSAAAFGLCAYKAEEPAPLQGAINFAVTNTIGAFFIVVGLALLYGRTGALNLAELGRAIGPTPDLLVVIAFFSLTLAFLVKGAIVPFHFWLADAHAVAPTPVCVLFSGIMVELGIFGIVRVHSAIFAGVLPVPGGLRDVFLVAGGITAVLGAVMAFAQRHLKRLLAYSTASHMGIALSAWALASPKGLAGGIAYLVGHGLTKAALFLSAGLVLHTLRDVDEIKLRGRGRSHPLVGAILALAALGLAGAPWGTLLGDSLLDDLAMKQHLHGFVIISWFAGIVTAAAALRAAGRIFLGFGAREPEAPDVGGIEGEAPETAPSPRRVPVPMLLAPIAALICGTLWNLWPPLRQSIANAAGQLADHAGYLARVLRGAQAESIAPHLAPPSWVHAVIPPLAALALAFLTLARSRLPFAMRRRAAGKLNIFWRPLRRLHSGHVGDQVAWLTFGAALFAVAFALLYR